MAILLASFRVTSAHAVNICRRQKAEVSQTSGEGQTTGLRLCSCNLHNKRDSCTYLEVFTFKVPDIEPTDSAKTLNKTGSAPFNGISEACRARAGSKDDRDALLKVQTDVNTDVSSFPLASSTVI